MAGSVGGGLEKQDEVVRLPRGRHVIARCRIVSIESERVVRIDEAKLGPPERSIRPGVVHIPCVLFRDDADDGALAFRRDGIDPHAPGRDRIEGEERDFGWFAARAFHAIDWIPQHVSGFVFAVAGNFEDALYCWRSQAAQWARPEEGIVLASGAGALGVKLGEVGSGEPPREDALAILEGMLWRVLVVWMIVFLLAAALQVA